MSARMPGFTEGEAGPEVLPPSLGIMATGFEGF